MNTNEQTLWLKIARFPFDEPGTAFQFSDRLARENGWIKTYALRVIEEYRKFLFLCCISQTGVTPSDPVDQAWHLHLTYTKSYWIELCRNTLEKEIHHNPTKGGKAEAEKFDGFYKGSHDLYKEKFGHEPPPDIWQDNKTRFADIDFQRVNKKRYWLVKKPSLRLKQIILPAALCFVASFFIQASALTIVTIMVVVILVTVIITAAQPFVNKERAKRSDGKGCDASSGGGYTGGGYDNHSGVHSSHDGGSGCNSGCSGCSSSGCSGCGGGD